MTAITAIIERDCIWMGGDRAGVGGHQIQIRRPAKVFFNDRMLFGYTSSFRMGQLLQYELKIPEYVKPANSMEYMVRRFIPAVRTCFREGGFEENNDGRDSGGSFLVGFAGQLYTVESDYQVSECLLNYTAIGSGSDLCLGSLHSTEGMDLDPGERIRLALEAAMEFCTSVRAPFDVEVHTGE